MLGNQTLPDPPGGMALFTGACLSAISQASITDAHSPIAGRGLTG